MRNTAYKRSAFFVLCTAVIFSVTLLSGNANALDGGVGAGVFIPQGDMADSFDIGYNVNAHVDFNIVPALIDLRLQADYYASNGKNNDDTELKFRSVGGEALLLFAPAVPVVKPYAGAGYGLYQNTVTAKNSSLGIDDEETDWGHGPVVVAGIGFEVLILRFGIDAKYFWNTSNGDNYNGASVGASASLSF